VTGSEQAAALAEAPEDVVYVSNDEPTDEDKTGVGLSA